MPYIKNFSDGMGLARRSQHARPPRTGQQFCLLNPSLPDGFSTTYQSKRSTLLRASSIKHQMQRYPQQFSKPSKFHIGGRLLCLALSALAFLASEAVAGPCSSSNITVTRVSSPIFYFDSRSPGIYDAYVAYSITNSTGSNIPDLWVKLLNFTGTGSVISLSTNENGETHVGPLANGTSKTVYFYLHASSETSNAQTHNVTLYPGKPSLNTATCATAFSYTTEDTLDANANKVTNVSFSPSTPMLGGSLAITVSGETGTIGNAGIFSFSPAALSTWPAGALELESVAMVLTGGNSQTVTNTLHLSGLNSAATNYSQTYTFRIKSPINQSTTIFPMNYINSGNPIKHTDTSNFASIGSIPASSNSVTISNISTTESSAASCFANGTGGSTVVTVSVSNSGSTAVSLDDIQVTLPSSPDTMTYSASSSSFNGTSIAEPVVSGQTLTWYGVFNVPANSSRDLTFTANVPNTDGLYSITAIGHIDSTVIDSTLNSSDNTAREGFTCVGPYFPAPTATPSQTPSMTPTSTPTFTPTQTPTSTPTPTRTPTSTPTLTHTPTLTYTPTATATSTQTPSNLDTDKDGIPDSVEGTGDADGDGIPNYQDLDSDGDGIPDIIEGGGTDSNGDGSADTPMDSDGDGILDQFDPDNGGNPQSIPDSDNDGKPDYLDGDSDNDGISDTLEGRGDDSSEQPSGKDSDQDGIDDTYDKTSGGEPSSVPDSDGDTVPDFRDLDSDGDGSSDSTEAFDFDGDGAPDVTPSGVDSDGDGVDDAFASYRQRQSLSKAWREAAGSYTCTKVDLQRTLRRLTRAQNQIHTRTTSFAAKARSCGDAGSSATILQSRALVDQISRLTESSCGGNIYSCPSGTCRAVSLLESKTTLRNWSRQLGAISKRSKLRAMTSCGAGPKKPGEVDTRKKSDDYTNDLIAAVNLLPDSVTRCP